VAAAPPRDGREAAAFREVLAEGRAGPLWRWRGRDRRRPAGGAALVRWLKRRLPRWRRQARARQWRYLEPLVPVVAALLDNTTGLGKRRDARLLIGAHTPGGGKLLQRRLERAVRLRGITPASGTGVFPVGGPNSRPSFKKTAAELGSVAAKGTSSGPRASPNAAVALRISHAPLQRSLLALSAFFCRPATRAALAAEGLLPPELSTDGGKKGQRQERRRLRRLLEDFRRLFPTRHHRYRGALCWALTLAQQRGYLLLLPRGDGSYGVQLQLPSLVRGVYRTAAAEKALLSFFCSLLRCPAPVWLSSPGNHGTKTSGVFWAVVPEGPALKRLERAQRRHPLPPEGHWALLRKVRRLQALDPALPAVARRWEKLRIRWAAIDGPARGGRFRNPPAPVAAAFLVVGASLGPPPPPRW